MDKCQDKIASGNDSHAAACGPSPGPGCSAKDSETAKLAINIAGYAIFCGCAIVLAIAFAIHPIAGGCVLSFMLFSLAKIIGQVAQELRGNKPNTRLSGES